MKNCQRMKKQVNWLDGKISYVINFLLKGKKFIGGRQLQNKVHPPFSYISWLFNKPKYVHDCLTQNTF